MKWIQFSSAITLASLLLAACGADDPTVDPSNFPAVPSPNCELPIAAVDTTAPDQVVGSGTPASCLEADLQTAVSNGGIITFNCGGATTIAITSPLTPPLDRNTTIDGGGQITLDGGRDQGRTTRIIEWISQDFRTSDVTLTLQGLTLQNAEAPAVDFTPPPAGDSRCSHGYKDGQGGAVLIRDGILHVIDSTFVGNRAAPIGPDTGGGAIYATGSRGVIVVESEFRDNQGSNGGAVGLLQSDGEFVNVLFEGNAATGTGANIGGATECGSFNHDNQAGAGGNAGAVYFDGDSTTFSRFCGVQFRNHTANAFGTVFRTPNGQQESMTFNNTSFENNQASLGGGAIYTQDMRLTVVNSSFSENTTEGSGGAIRLEQGAHGSSLQLQNVTLFGNEAQEGLGGALVYTGGGLIRNVTFAENRAIGGFDPNAGDNGAAYFGAAIFGGHSASDPLVIHNSLFANNTDTHPFTPMTCRISGSPEAFLGSNTMQWPQFRVGEDGMPSDIEDNPCIDGVQFADPQLVDALEPVGNIFVLPPRAESTVRGVGTDCPAIDATGAARSESGCTLGAVE